MPLEEEGESLPQADDEREAGQEQQLWERGGREHRHSGFSPRSGPRGSGAGPKPRSGMGQDLPPRMCQNPRALSNLSWLETELPKGRGLDKENIEGL